MKTKLVSFALVLIFALAACAPAPTPAPTPVPPTAAPTIPPTDAAPAFPTGKFIREDNPDAGMLINADGTWSAFNGIYTLARGTYEVKGDLFIETSNDSDGACPTPMNFKYVIDGNKLTFTYEGNPADDSCDGRRDGFDNVTYILSE